MPRIEENMKINLYSTLFQQKMTSLIHNMPVLIVPIFFCMVTGAKRLVGVLPLPPPPGRLAPIMLCLIFSGLTKSYVGLSGVKFTAGTRGHVERAIYQLTDLPHTSIRRLLQQI